VRRLIVACGRVSLSYVILVAIGEGGASPPELVDMLSGRGQMFWTSQPSQIYGEPKRLLELGWITAEKQPAARRSTVYHLTETGRAALFQLSSRPLTGPRGRTSPTHQRPDPTRSP
jgi:PadR family transcriptional regulator, regulatory protein AphA